jgi:hypothetical protein
MALVVVSGGARKPCSITSCQTFQILGLLSGFSKVCRGEFLLGGLPSSAVYSLALLVGFFLCGLASLLKDCQSLGSSLSAMTCTFPPLKLLMAHPFQSTRADDA